MLTSIYATSINCEEHHRPANYIAAAIRRSMMQQISAIWCITASNHGVKYTQNTHLNSDTISILARYSPVHYALTAESRSIMRDIPEFSTTQKRRSVSTARNTCATDDERLALHHFLFLKSQSNFQSPFDSSSAVSWRRRSKHRHLFAGRFA